MNENTLYFGLGFITATVGVFVVAKIMKPQIVNVASTVTTESLIRFGQARGIDIAAFGGTPEIVKNQLIAPAINNALTSVWI